MQRLGKPILGTLAGILLISGLAILNPRAVRAAVATVTRDQDNPARHPFTTNCAVPFSKGNSASCDTPAVPAGEEVVIEAISVNGAADSNNFVLLPQVATTAAGQPQTYSLNPAPDSGLAQPTEALYQELKSVRLYADPGTTITCTVSTPHPSPTLGLFFVCTISGYFVTLP